MAGLLNLALLFASIFHPFKISVCEFNYNTNNKSLETTIKIFVDDLEFALSDIYKKSISVQDINQESRKYVSDYISEKLSLYLNQSILKGKFVGYELEDDVIWIYVEYADIKKIKHLEIQNRILSDTFPEQTNLIHIKYHNKIKSKMCDRDNDKAVFEDFDDW